jgi:hypothetical protein
MEKPNFSLKYVTQTTAIERANSIIAKSMRDVAPGLFSRWHKLNQAVGGAFRFGQSIYILGASGSGKSYILNMLRDDFASQINKNFKYDYKILSFTFEMNAHDEIIRTYTGRLSKSYSDLMSVENRLTDEEYSNILDMSKTVDTDKIYYVETAGNRTQILNTVEAFHAQFPDSKLVITLDHTLLVEYLDESSETELVSAFSKIALYIRKKYNALVIVLGQLNDNIESPDRIKTPSQHYPKKGDIFSSRQVYQIADTVIIINRPERLGIEYYGTSKFPTKDLVAMHILKSRHYGKEGMIRFKQGFDKGTLYYPYDMEIT